MQRNSSNTAGLTRSRLAAVGTCLVCPGNTVGDSLDYARLREGTWMGEGGGGSLSPSCLRDITDRIALTNGHLSVSVTQ